MAKNQGVAVQDVAKSGEKASVFFCLVGFGMQLVKHWKAWSFIVSTYILLFKEKVAVGA